MAYKCMTSIEYHSAALTEATPDLYDARASGYDEYAASLNYQAPRHIVSIWQSYHDGCGSDHRVFDAGCGTGHVGEEMRKVNSQVQIFGGDFSPGMIEYAKSRDVYNDLKVINLKEKLPYELGMFDSIISSGVFIPGHCGPECLVNILRVLKQNGYFVTTIRERLYRSFQEDWIKAVKDCGCTQIYEEEIPYYTDMIGLAIVIQKV
jgi:predicted TPR repeat methyltransferase